jgi:hypothetical protein
MLTFANRDAMKNRQANGFWAGGYEAYLRALREEEDDRLDPLRQALKNETDPEIECSLKEKIKSIQAEFQEKRTAADSSLF